jgi:hypothetical protein
VVQFLDPKQSLKFLMTAFGNWYNHRKKLINTMDKVTTLFDRSSSNSDRSMRFINVLNSVGGRLEGKFLLLRFSVLFFT